jgi:8-oxo-dGTP pyrophosphatase MutT (NUDIX family)
MAIPPEWKRLWSHRHHDFTILKVREDIVEDPRDGSEHPRVVIEAPDWVNVVAVTRDEQVVLIRQFRAGVWANTLEIPGGMVDPGEDPQAAAIRELEEETGYRPQRVVPLGWVHPNPALQANKCHSFLALDCEKVGEASLDEGEDIEVVVAPRAELPRLVREGKITHALVVAAFHLAALAEPPR